MSEYEIFNNTEEPSPKPKKQRVQKQKTSSCFLKDAFSFENLALPLSIFGILFSILSRFIAIFSSTYGAYITFAVFSFLGLALAFSSMVIEAVKAIKNKCFAFSIKIVFAVISLLVSILVLI